MRRSSSHFSLLGGFCFEPIVIMTKRSLIRLLLVGLVATTAADARRRRDVEVRAVQESVLLDLFVQDSFTKYDLEYGSPHENTTQECSACEASVRDNNCFVGLRFFLQDECELLTPGLFGKISFVSTTDSACVQSFEDEDCTIPITSTISGNSSTLCFDTWEMNTCGVSDLLGTNRVIRRLEDWCIRSNASRGEYTIPLIRQSVYRDVFGTVTDSDVKEACEARNASFLTFQSAFPMSGQDCYYEPVDTDPTVLDSVNETDTTLPAVVQGSAQAFCNEETGELNIRLFTNTNCSTNSPPPSPQPFFPKFNVSSYPQCSSPFEAYGLGTLNIYRTSNCQTPTVFCKPVAGIGSAYITDLGSPSPVPILPSATILPTSSSAPSMDNKNEETQSPTIPFPTIPPSPVPSMNQRNETQSPTSPAPSMDNGNEETLSPTTPFPTIPPSPAPSTNQSDGTQNPTMDRTMAPSSATRSYYKFAFVSFVIVMIQTRCLA